jgi:hypothetical protein
MRRQLRELEKKREVLIARANGQRVALAAYSAPLALALGNVDRARELARSVAAKPLLLAAGVAVLFVLGKRRVGRLLRRASSLALLARPVYRWWLALRPGKK